MKKYIFAFLLILQVIFQAKAQKKDTIIYYIARPFKLVKSIDSAEYIRVITSPDPSDKTGLFSVTDIYKNGKKKMAANSHISSHWLKIEGACISYFPSGYRKSIITYVNGIQSGQAIEYYPNGHTKSQTNFANGHASGEAIEYYPNGKQYAVKNFNNSGDVSLIECRDSTGKVLAENGNGTWLDLTEDHSIIYEQGQIIKGVRQGAWIKFIDDKQFPFEYRNGKAILTVNYDRTGEILSMSESPPCFQDKENGLLDFLSNNVRYPSDAVFSRTTGVVWLSFVVEKDGSLSDVKADHAGLRSLGNEAIATIKKIPVLIPGFMNGKPVRTLCKIPISFCLSQDQEEKSPAGGVIITAGGIR